MPDWKKLLVGGDSPQSAYDESVIEGLVDPKKVSLPRFKYHTQENSQYHVDPGLFEERKTSRLGVADLFRRK